LPEEIPERSRVKPAFLAAAVLTHFDWRQYSGYDWMTSVKDQGSCGSCVAFGSIGALEGQLRIQTNNPSWSIDLSEQHLFSCGGGSCQTGWYISAALSYLQQYGTPDEACFPYQQGDSTTVPCSNTCSDWQSRSFKISSWFWTTTSPSDIEAALINGPLVARFDVYYDFYSYSGGIYHHTSGTWQGGHCIAIVGYDSNQQYWICKNSWGSTWGENGYFRIGFGECNIEASVASIRAISTATITFQVSGASSDASGTLLTIDGTAYSYGQFPVQFAAWTIASTHTVAASDPVSAGSGKRYAWTSWTNGDGLSAASGTYTVPPSSQTVTANYVTQWLISFTSSGIGADTSTNTVVTVNGVNYAKGSLPYTAWYNNGASISYAYASPVYSTTTGKRYSWSSTSGLGQTAQSGTFSASATGTVTGTYVTQYQLIISVYPVGGGSTNPSPGSYWHDSGSSITVNETQATGYVFFQWELDGSNVGSNPSYAVSMNSAHTLTAIFRSTLPSPFFHAYTVFWFTWYDKKNTQTDNIHFVNLGASSASITVSIAGSQVDSFSLGAGQSTYRNYPGICNGPVHIMSDQPIWCSQRVVGWGSFKETPGLPVDMASTEICYTWYDMKYASWDAIHFLNPSSTQTAHVDVYIAGIKKTSSPITIDPGKATYVTYAGEIGGPVRIVSDIPIFSTQRVVGWSDFDEITGMPSWYIFKEHWFNWYDRVGASVDNIHFINMGSSTANIQVYIGGTLRGSYTLGPGAASYVNYPSLVGGPVRIVSDQPIWCTQRIIGWGGFKEEFSVPTEHMSTKWFFNWYDKLNTQIDNIHFLNPGTLDAHITVTIAGTSYGPYTVPAGGAYYISCPGVCNGPVIVESDVPIMVSQRIVGWSSFEETIGIQWT